jgi:hypothetical protein
MSYRHLAGLRKKRQTGLMRVPRSSRRSLLVSLFSIGLSLFLAALLPAHAGAATQQLQCSPTTLRFGTVAVGQTETQLVTVTNTGQTTATISALSVGVGDFGVSGITLPAVLSAGQSLDLNVTFSPTATGWVGGKILIANDTSNPHLQFGVTGSGVSSDTLTAAPTSLSFGEVPVGSTTSLSVVLTNTRSSKNTVNSAQTIGSGFSVTGLTFPLTLNAGQSVTMTVNFAPQVAGLTGGSVFLSGPNLNIPFAGTGSTIGQLTIAPSALNFGTIDIGNSKTQTATLSATGGSVTISSAASSNPQFTVSGVSLPLTLNAGQSVNLYLVFSPTQSGTDSATLTVISNASDTKTTESLTGAGIAAQHSVALSWSPSTSSVVGYNVYRGASPAAYSRINSSLDPNTAYTDNTVAAGMTYYYAATAVDSSGQESSYSSPIQVVIP